MGGVLVLSPYQFGTVTPYEGFVGALSEEGVGVIGILPGIFACLTRWCVRDAVHVLDGAVGVVNIWLVVVDVIAMFSAVAPKIVAIYCNASPCCP